MKNLIKTTIATAAIVLTTTVANADVKIGIAAEPYPPFSEKGADGTWQGWEIEIIGAVCAAMEEECEIVPVAWDGIIPALLAEKFDVIMASMSITEERMKTIDFSDRYYNTPAVIIGPEGSDISGDPASLDGKIVGVQVATTHANYVDAYFAETAEVKTYSTFDEHNQDLFAGRVDAVVADSLAMQAFLSSDQGDGFEIKGELNDAAIFGPGVGGGMRKGETELAEKLNAAIAQIRADGTYDEISSRYFDFDIYGGE
ncbi:transporter substrate-binding domain-containing protein [Roseobacter weihaiensis]|uniref:transporter substrate-binding domain-containing protein n=1 Tax=Roseobacter weihaiensis TaxID=2763262 RepID=UPI001D0B3FDD|nr:transporter substrate-binding domain-containing protein [Roseobacter sp. H9]